jgi:hypothetical protein
MGRVGCIAVSKKEGGEFLSRRLYPFLHLAKSECVHPSWRDHAGGACKAAIGYSGFLEFGG